MNPFYLFSLLRRRRILAGRVRWTREQLSAWKEQEFRRLREFAHARSPFYRDFHRGLERAPLSELPVLTKGLLMENFDTLVTDPAVRLADLRKHLSGPDAALPFLGRYQAVATSGSSGRPGLLLYSASEWLSVLTSYARANDWAGVPAGLFHRLKVAVVSTRNPLHQSARVGLTLASRWVPTLRLDATEPLEALTEKLNAFQPQSLVGYASMLKHLAESQISGNLRIKPKAVFSSSEVLTRESREKIRAAWGVAPFNVFAATETAGMASECSKHAGLHLYEDLVLLENVDEKNRPVPPSEFGAKLLATVFFSRTQPLIRYEITDSVRLADQSCVCGSPFGLVVDIQGRCEDAMQVSGAGGFVTIHPNVFHDRLEMLPAREWQVVQDSDSRIRILAVGLPPGFDPAPILESLRTEISQKGGRLDSLDLETVESIAKGPNGKMPLVRAFRRVV